MLCACAYVCINVVPVIVFLTWSLLAESGVTTVASPAPAPDFSYTRLLGTPGQSTHPFHLLAFPIIGKS